VSGRRALLLAGALLAVTGCTAAHGQACPTVGWGSALVVRLGEGWPADVGRTVSVECPGGCGIGPDDEEPLTAALGGAEVALSWVGGGEDVVVTVTGPGEHAEVATDLVWRQVGGSAECGGPMEATVTVPAP
jgi:hypothetical protein